MSIQLEDLIGQTSAEPRDYQMRIMSKTLGHFEGVGLSRPARSVMIESPTGSGKTIMGLMAARMMQELHGARIGWVSMRRNLLRQAESENIQKNIGANIKFISMFDKNPPTDVDMLIVDEAQHDAASSMASMYNLIRPKWVLGLSATPFRTDRMKLCFDKIVKDASIHELIRLGYLSDFEHFTIQKWTPDSVAKTYLRERERWGKSLVFFLTIAECYAFARKMKRARVRTEVVTGSTDREAQLAKFDRGEVDLIVNSMVLTEGFDCPSLQTVFCRDGSKLPTIQMGGRVLRKCEGIQKQIVQSSNTKYPFVMQANSKMSWLWEPDNNKWLALKALPNLNNHTLHIIRTMASVKTSIPEHIEKRMKKKKRRRFNSGE